MDRFPIGRAPRGRPFRKTESLERRRLYTVLQPPFGTNVCFYVCVYVSVCSGVARVGWYEQIRFKCGRVTRRRESQAPSRAIVRRSRTNAVMDQESQERNRAPWEFSRRRSARAHRNGPLNLSAGCSQGCCHSMLCSRCCAVPTRETKHFVLPSWNPHLCSSTLRLWGVELVWRDLARATAAPQQLLTQERLR